MRVLLFGYALHATTYPPLVPFDTHALNLLSTHTFYSLSTHSEYGHHFLGRHTLDIHNESAMVPLNVPLSIFNV
jgi:hypothetical protein